MALGFAGYPELRQALRPLVLGGVRPVSEMERTLLREAMDSEIRNLTQLRDRLPELPLKELGESLAATEPLAVLGLRVSAGLATTFASFAGRVHPEVRLFTNGGSALIEGLHSVRRAGADWLLAFVLPRYPAEAVQAVKYAQKLGLKVAAITDKPAFPADIVLDAPVGDRLVFDSHAAPMALAMALVEAMADAAPLRTQARLEEYERMTEEAGTFLTIGPT